MFCCEVVKPIPLSCAALTLLCACTALQQSAEYETIPSAALNARESARQANARGLAHAAVGRYDQAEQAFREALAADIGYAAAHNNLAIVLSAQGELYQAVMEGNFALRLAPPGSIEPRITLGEIYERIPGNGWLSQALTLYEEAYVLAPHDVEVIGRLARACIKADAPHPELQRWLEVLAGASNPHWQQWAQRELEAVRTATVRRPSAYDIPD